MAESFNLSSLAGSAQDDVYSAAPKYREFSRRLKEKPMVVKLHVSLGTLADGVVGIEVNKEGKAQLVVKAVLSSFFGMVQRNHSQTFSLDDVERPGNPTTTLLRSVNAIVRGDTAAKEDLLARSLSLIQESETADLTFRNVDDRNRFCEWVQAKYSEADVDVSFRRRPRIDLALAGRSQGREDNDMPLIKETDQSSLPVLSPKTRQKLQDDLLGGLHVYYHDASFQGYTTGGSPHRLRFDCLSDDHTITLEPSFEGGGVVIKRSIDDLVQIGGGPSPHSLTTLLLRVTRDNPEARDAAVSLVFSDVSMDMTLGSKQDAEELVLYFSEVAGFIRA